VPLTGNFSRTRFGYTGHQREAATGNWYSVYRHLDPRTGRWTQRDPIGFKGRVNLYPYVGNNPISATDPEGLQAERGDRKGDDPLRRAWNLYCDAEFATCSAAAASTWAACKIQCGVENELADLLPFCKPCTVDCDGNRDRDLAGCKAKRNKCKNDYNPDPWKWF
jgi:RHS repeat-associated protein